MTVVAVTGASGFVGSALTAALQERGNVVVPVYRSRPPSSLSSAGVSIGDIDGETSWRPLFDATPVDVVVHCAALTHVPRTSSLQALSQLQSVNVKGTLNLAQQAIGAGVRRFVHISSIKVNGEGTNVGIPYVASDVPRPEDPYGATKLAAEEGLRDLAAVAPLELVIVRPVLIYGPRVKGSFRTLMVWMQRGVPLPLGRIDNRRSLVSLGNLVDCIATCIEHPAAGGETFLVSDGEDLSTPDLLRRISRALNVRARLLPAPVALLRLAGRLSGRQRIVRRLCCSLQVDIRHTCGALGWTPPETVDKGIEAAVASFLDDTRS